MNRIKTIGFYFLFFSLPVVAILKGKAILLSFILAFFLFDGIRAIREFIKRKEWESILRKNIYTLILPLTLLTALVFFNGTTKDLFYELRLFLLLTIVFFAAKGARNLPPQDRQKISHIFLWGYLVYLLFFLFELYGGSWVSKLFFASPDYNANLFIRGIVILTFLFLPFTFLIKNIYAPQKRVVFLTLGMVCLGLTLIKAQPSAARLAILVAGIFFTGAYFQKKFCFLIMGTVMVYIVVVPFLFLHYANRQTLFNHMHYLPTSYQHRVEIWHEISKNIMERPLSGHGFDYGARLKESGPRCSHHKAEEFQKLLSDPTLALESATPTSWGGVLCHKETILTTHPHNGALQIWLEFGLCGVFFACFLLYRLGRHISLQPPLYRGYLFSLFGLCLVYWNISFGLWQKWMIALSALTFCLFQIIKSLPSDKKGKNECTN